MTRYDSAFIFLIRKPSRRVTGDDTTWDEQDAIRIAFILLPVTRRLER